MSNELQQLGSNALTAPPAPVLPAEPLERLPLVPDVDADPYWRLVTAFLVGYPPHSSRAYFSDLKAWYAWCARWASIRSPRDAITSTSGCATSARRRSRGGDGRRRRRRSPGGCRV